MNCAKCNAKPKTEGITRMPTGWKRKDGATYCQACWRGEFVLRPVQMRIVHPSKMEWKEFRELAKESFDRARFAVNWAIRQLAMHDPGPTNVDGKWKLPKLPEVTPDGQSIYKGIMARWDMDTNTASCLVNAAKSKYKAHRFNAWVGKSSIPSIRVQPIPVHNRTWSVREADDGGIFLTFPLGRLEPGKPRKVEVRLAGGVNYRRQLHDVRRIISGEAVQGQLDLVTRKVKGSEFKLDYIAKMVGWFPKVQRFEGWAAAMHTGGDALLTLYNDERRQILRWNADHVRRRITAQQEQMQRLREDLKAEKRLGRERDGILARMAQLRQKHYDYMHTFCHSVSKQVVGHLSRRRCSVLMCVDADKSYAPDFPWEKLLGMVADKSNRAGIEFARGAVTQESP